MVVDKKIFSEIKHICSDDHDSILRDCFEAVRRFSWETVYLELQKQMPTLVMFLSLLLGRRDKHKHVVCLMASIVLKLRYPKMGLVQRGVSLFLFGNGVSKEVSIHAHAHDT